VEETAVRFYVPDFMLNDRLQPNAIAMHLVEVRMGWDVVRKYGQIPS
jgi:hypothetical protein